MVRENVQIAGTRHHRHRHHHEEAEEGEGCERWKYKTHLFLSMAVYFKLLCMALFVRSHCICVPKKKSCLVALNFLSSLSLPIICTTCFYFCFGCHGHALSQL
jgi:hypothetical protein